MGSTTGIEAQILIKRLILMVSANWVCYDNISVVAFAKNEV